MNTYKVFGIVCLTITMVIATPVQLTNNEVFADFLQNAQLAQLVPNKERAVVKRRVFEDNPDSHLKQISLRSLIGDLEKNLFASALSVNKVLTDKDVIVPEITPNDDSQHNITPSVSLLKEETNESVLAATTTTATSIEPSASSPVTDKVIFQTTEKSTPSNGVPAHIVIDRIAIQPHTSGLTLIPIFNLESTKNNEDSNNEHKITKITISKTEMTSLAAATESSTPPSATSTTTKSKTTSWEASTTPKNVDQLKEAEEKLKEKVAEIEAEPIILSARV